jgi:hypothetical protein
MTDVKQRKPPKGGRKGGTVFPRINLKQAHEYANKLVAKTHTGAQPEKIILPGVFNSSGPEGRVRASALKQYSLLEGEPTAYQASELAKDLQAAPPEELYPLLQRACLAPARFKALFDTFHNDTVNAAKIRQQAIKLKVHPESADECVRIFVDSLVYAKLAEVAQDDIVIGQAPTTAVEPTEGEKPVFIEDTPPADEEHKTDTELPAMLRKPTPAAQVNISVDSSMDPEKLERLLKLLKQYGAI